MKSFARLLAAIAAWICILLPATGVAAEATGMPIPAANERGPRIAVVIGNAKYPSGSLANPRNDATAMAEALTLLGFQVDLKLDATKADIDAIFRRFSARADSAAVAALFYAGHGIQVAGSNYIVPIDANPRHERDLKRDMVKMDDVIDDMGAARVKLVFFDACRDNPLARSFSRGSARGMAAPVEATGTLISFATKHGNTAADGEGLHSPYATALLSALKNPAGVEIEQMLRGVQQSVKQATNGQQEPWRYGSLDGDFLLQAARPGRFLQGIAGRGRSRRRGSDPQGEGTGGARKSRAAEVDQGTPGSQRTRHCRRDQGAEAGQVKARSPRRCDAATNRRRASAKISRNQWRKCSRMHSTSRSLPAPRQSARRNSGRTSRHGRR
jgi:hypothetical protein